MRPGGAYEDLRKEFNTVLNDDPAFRSTYGHAADALSSYGKARESIIKTIPNQPNAKEWTAHFEKLDAEIGETASNIPGREKGSPREPCRESPGDRRGHHQQGPQRPWLRSPRRIQPLPQRKPITHSRDSMTSSRLTVPRGCHATSPPFFLPS